MSNTKTRAWCAGLGAALLVACGGHDANRVMAQRVSLAPLDPDDPQQPFIADVRSQLHDERFERLDATADDLCRGKARFPGGDWKLHRFTEAVKQPARGEKASEKEWRQHIALLERWRARRPHSINAVLALADAWGDYGWKARGHGFADEVTPDGWRLFHERLARAEKVFVEPDGAPACPHWYRVKLDLGMSQGWDRRRIDEAFEQAMRVEPLYLHVYSARARYLLPRWGGTQGEWERFADQVSKRIGGREGSVVYAHIAWQVSQLFSSSEFFEQTGVSWDRVRQGFIDREALYGPSVRTMNGFCLLAGSAGDLLTTRALLTRIGDTWDPEIWKERRYFDAYRVWALGAMLGRPTKSGT